ncbi:adenylate/guanylate cyclase domain-containing protein [Candidatus Leptofilum sp.]|uniref:adenylate/guanylate cyclase domain-containing protein n=1 Tax=Candidatus Leptofilum sp. TaxID=3241576 RepID=UPI003B5C51CC
MNTEQKSISRKKSNSEPLTEAELSQLHRFLPANLMQSLVEAGAEPPRSLLSACVGHLASLLEATTSHLPASLVRQVRRNPQPGLADGEFVEGTLLFADISGFTAMSERLSQIGREGAEEVTEVVNRYFDAMLDILRAHEGQLIRFGGDALLGLFTENGATHLDDMFPELSGNNGENSATLAIQAAMKMQAAMADFAETKTSQGTFPLRMSVGIKRGRFFAAQLGSIENMEYALFGSDVNATAAVESAASAGQVLIDQQTYDAVSADVMMTAVPLPEDPRFLLVEYIDQPPNRVYSPPQETLYPLTPDLASLRRHITWLATFTPYLPTGLLPRLASDPRAPGLKGEHRLVASLFANVDGLGDAVARLGNGQEAKIVELLNQYYVSMSDAIRPYGGVMNKVDLYDHGDKVLVTFGAPIAHEDDAERAVRAALAMQEALEELNQTLPTAVGLADWQLSQRIGISYSYVFAGYVGASWRHEYTVMGDEVNLAARLMSVAKDGLVLVNDNVRRQTESVAELRPEGEVNLKGKSQPVPIFAVAGLQIGTEQSSRELQGLQAPTVGRANEQFALQEAIDQLTFGFGRIVSLIGEAGQGKSRLAYEAQQSDMRWLHVRCLSFMETVSYRPFRELVRQLAGIQPEVEAAQAFQTLRQTLFETLPKEEAADSLPYLANFLKLPLDDTLAQKIRYLDGEALQQHTFIAIRSLLMAQARTRPFVIWFDNIHWMDNASLDLLTFLLPLVEQLPLMFLLLFRPEREKGCWQLRNKLEEDHGLHYTEIRVEGLSREDARTLLHSLVPSDDWPEGAETLILDRAEGNPLYLEEVLRSLMNDDLLTEGENGRWQFNQTVASITVPETLEGVLLARLDRLEELCRWTAQVASVVGRSFPFDVLEHITSGRNDQPLDGYVSELQLVEMIREAQRNPERVYAFIHSLLQEVAYNSLAVSSRKTYHRLVAAFLEDGRTSGWGDVDSLPPLIAHHAFMGEDWPRALKYQLMAGEQAQHLSANQDAIDHFLKARHAATQIEAFDTAVPRQHIHLSLGQLYVHTGQYDQALEHLPIAFELAETNHDPAGKTAVCRWRARLHELKGEYPQAFIWIEKGLADESQRNTAEYAQILLIAGLINIRQGQQEEALEQCRNALEIAEQLGEVTALGRAYNLLGITSLGSDSNTAIAQFQRAYELYQQAGDVQGQATSHNLIANAYFNLGRWRKADFHYRQALRIFEQVGDIYNQAIAYNNLGGIAKNRGQLDEALDYYRQGLQLAEKLGSAGWIAGGIHMNLGAAFVRQRDAAQAYNHLHQSRRFYEEIQSKDFLAETLRYLAEAALLDGDLGRAKAWATEAFVLAEELEMTVDVACCRCVLGQIALKRGDLAMAESNLRQSVTLLAASSDEYQLARSRYWLGRLLLQRGDLDEATVVLTQAQETFAHLDAEMDLTAVQTLQHEHDLI